MKQNKSMIKCEFYEIKSLCPYVLFILITLPLCGCLSEHVEIFPNPNIGVELSDITRYGFKETPDTDIPTYFLLLNDTTIFYGFDFNGKRPLYKSWEIKFDFLDFNTTHQFMVKSGFIRRSCMSGEFEKENRLVYFNPGFNQLYEIMPNYKTSTLSVYYHYPYVQDNLR